MSVFISTPSAKLCRIIAVDDVEKCLSKFELNENTQMAMVMAPNAPVDVSRASFITKKTTLTIANGML